MCQSSSGPAADVWKDQVVRSESPVRGPKIVASRVKTPEGRSAADREKTCSGHRGKLGQRAPSRHLGGLWQTAQLFRAPKACREVACCPADLRSPRVRSGQGEGSIAGLLQMLLSLSFCPRQFCLRPVASSASLHRQQHTLLQHSTQSMLGVLC